MSQNVLIISPEEVKLNSRIEINADDKTLRDLVIITQDTKLQGILGSTLYNSAIDAIYDFKVNSVVMPTQTQDLIEYIKPYLRYQVVSDFIMVNHYKLTNKGTFKLNDDNATAANNGEIEWFRSYYDNTTASYKERLVKYVSDNKLNTEKKVDTDFEFRGVYLDVAPSCSGDSSLIDTSVSFATNECGQVGFNPSGGTNSLLAPLYSNVLLIDADEVKATSRIEINSDNKTIRELVKVIQDTKLSEIVGNDLYYDILAIVYNHVNSGVVINDNVNTLLFHIKEWLKYQVVADFIMVNHYKMTNKGSFKLNDDNATAASNSEIEWYRTFYDNTAASYKKKLIDYMKLNNILDARTDRAYEYRGVYLDSKDTCGTSNISFSNAPGGGSGAFGSQGPEGAAGATGPQGLIGYQGFQGETGVQGEQGLIGYQGVQGSIGLQGNQGNTGFQGVQGQMGMLDWTPIMSGGWTYSINLNSFIRTSNGATAWGRMYSQEAYYGGIYISFRAKKPTSPGQIYVGMEVNPQTTPDPFNIPSYQGMDYAIYLTNTTFGVFVNSGSFGIGSWNESDVFTMHWNGAEVRMYRNNIPMYNAGSYPFTGTFSHFAAYGYSTNSELIDVVYTNSGSIGSRGLQGWQGPVGFQGNQGTGVQGATGATGIRGASDWTPIMTNVTQSAINSMTFTKTGGFDTNWDAQVYSQQGYVRGCYVTTRVSSTSGSSYIGLDSNPSVSAHFTSIDYAFYLTEGNVEIYENGSYVNSFGSYTTNTTLYVIYDGYNVRYYRDGTLLRTVARPIGSALYLDSSIYTSGLSFNNLAFGPMGEAGIQGPAGFQGLFGFQGVQGNIGATGIQGPQGQIGSQGNQGQLGPQGQVGLQGNQGFQGVVGSQGNQGQLGPQGQVGLQGNQGLAGQQGLQGLQGSIGHQGVQGNIGATGLPGVGGTVAYELSYFDTTDQTNDNAINVFKYNTLDFEYGITIASQSQISFSQEGTYNIQFSAQVSKTDSGEDYIEIWLVKNGVALPWTNTLVELDKNAIKIVAAWNWLVQAQAGDKYEIAWRSDDVDVYLHAQPSRVVGGNTIPAIPSVILTVSQVTYTQEGPTGAQGPIGLQGFQGNQGSVGLQGNTGFQGNQGNEGIQGTTGFQGNEGNQGIQGITGFQGNQGNQGIQGITGFQGNQGNVGEQGIQGTTGFQGNTGAQGVQGITGFQGNQGNVGAQGIQGITGFQGNTGAQGTTGFQGNQGNIGAQGTQGIQGITGFQGNTGAQGTIGFQGNQGNVGAQGTTGFQGNVGAQGTTGQTGAQGTTGFQGFQGNTGAQGTQGITGFQGNQGNVGAQGTQGIQGITGFQGNQGNVGAQGTQGIQGVTGFQGNQGNIGAQGTTGFQGFQGNVGAQGTTGQTGAQGTQGIQGITGFQGNQGNVGAQGTQGITGFQGNQGNAGIQGITGFQGFQGNVGAQGTTGTTGAQGTTGLQGSVGAQGTTGFQGFQGNVGAQGTTGTTGAQGTTGFQGNVGAQGTTGFQGNVGAQGTTGTTGAQGTQGIQGITGFQGNQGFQGIQGITGFQGNQGNVGAQGITGTTGAQGTTGFQGFQGNVGAQGTTGTTGVQGTTGFQGFQGNVGAQGTTGTTGAQGTTGFQGNQGNQGIQGITGFQGNQGNVGAQGTIGTTGAQGTQGIQGIRGFQGFQGFQGVQGITGFQGNQGNVGAQGTTGTTGAQGTTGFQGFQGNVGAQGTTGNTGAQGTTGFQGFQGNVGAQGTTGTTGAQGTTGFQGFQGSVGAQGTTGTTGAQGTTGFQGFQGVQGITGTNGSTGAQGTTGFQGFQGFQGVQGITGVNGTQGFQGNQGWQGVAGVGTQGNQGPSGAGGGVSFNRQTSSYTLVAADAGKIVEMNVSTANNLTIPLNSSVAFATGTEITIAQYGAGRTTIVPTSGVTIRSINSWTKANGQYSFIGLVKVGTDEWYCFGDLSA